MLPGGASRPGPLSRRSPIDRTAGPSWWPTTGMLSSSMPGPVNRSAHPLGNRGPSGPWRSAPTDRARSRPDPTEDRRMHLHDGADAIRPFHDGELRHWDAATGRLLARTALAFSGAVAFSRDGRRGVGISAMTRTSWVCSMDLATGTTDPPWKHNASGGVTYLGPGPIQPRAIGFRDRTIAIRRDGGAGLFEGVFRDFTVEEPAESPADPRSTGRSTGVVAMENPGPIQAVGAEPRWGDRPDWGRGPHRPSLEHQDRQAASRAPGASTRGHIRGVQPRRTHGLDR